MKHLIRSGLIAAALIAAIFFLVSCGDLSVLMAQLDDDVKLANDRYLEVVETFPEQNDQNLSPKIELLVSLDRDVDPEALRPYLLIEQRDSGGTVTEFGESLDVDETLTIEFSSSDKTLSIRPYPFWAGGDKITISFLPGAMALDGSVLRKLYSWSFYTVKVPVGAIDIADGPNAQPGYSPTGTPDIDIAFSNAGEYYLDWDEAFVNDDTISDTWVWKSNSVKSGAESPTVAAVFPLGNSGLATLPQGSNKIYAVFKDPATNTLSDPVSDTVFVDTVDPAVTPFSNVTTRSNATLNRTVTFTENGSLFQKVLWTSTNGAIFGSPTSITTSIRGPSGDYVSNLNATATVYDNAGNTGSRTFTYFWDNQPPGRPNITTTSSTETGNPALSWSWSSGTLYNGDSNGGYNRRLGVTPYGGKASWSGWASGTSPYNYTASTSSFPKAVGWYYYDLQVQQFDGLGNASAIDTSDRIYFQSVRPFYGGTTNYYSKAILTAVMTLDWPNYPPGLSILQDYKAQYRKVGSGTWKSAAVASRDGSSATVPIGADIMNRTGNYEWRYQIVTSKLVNYTSPTFYFTVTNNLF